VTFTERQLMIYFMFPRAVMYWSLQIQIVLLWLPVN